MQVRVRPHVRSRREMLLLSVLSATNAQPGPVTIMAAPNLPKAQGFESTREFGALETIALVVLYAPVEIFLPEARRGNLRVRVENAAIRHEVSQWVTLLTIRLGGLFHGGRWIESASLPFETPANGPG